MCVSVCAYVCLVMFDSRDPVDCSPPGSSVHVIFQARILEQAAISFSRDFPDLGIEPASYVSCIGRQVLYH